MNHKRTILLDPVNQFILHNLEVGNTELSQLIKNNNLGELTPRQIKSRKGRLRQGLRENWYNLDGDIAEVLSKQNEMKKTQQSLHIDRLIKENIDKPTVELQRFLKFNHGITLEPGAIRKRISRLRKEGDKQAKELIAIRREKLFNDPSKTDKKQIDILLKENEELKKIVNIFDSTQDFNPISIHHTIKDSDSKSDATAVVLASDWHIEQRVDPSRLTYHNEYNLEIAKQRAEQFAIGVVKLIKKEQSTFNIENLVLWLGGDFISGNIHESLRSICLLGPSPAIIFAQELIVGAIQYILDNTDVKITCPTSIGNHTRITKKVWVSTEEDNALETIIYYNIKQYFRYEKRFELIMPVGPVVYLDIYGKEIGFAHGHHGIKFQGGVGGLAVPLKRHIMRKYSRRNLYMLCIGHWHSYEQYSNCAVNGSMIGWDDYSESCGFDFDVPRQTFFLVEKKRQSRTVTTPIMFDI